LISRQEHEAWEVLLACQGQLRLAPGGHVIGIDMGVALKIGAARGSDLAVLSELLPAAEAGLIETLCLDQVRGALIRPSNARWLPACRHLWVLLPGYSKDPYHISGESLGRESVWVRAGNDACASILWSAPLRPDR
jgi:hypothetical protein